MEGLVLEVVTGLAWGPSRSHAAWLSCHPSGLHMERVIPSAKLIPACLGQQPHTHHSYTLHTCIEDTLNPGPTLTQHPPTRPTRYIKSVPPEQRRKKGGKCLDPCTPDVNQKISKRAFDGQIKAWRRDLHKYDEQCHDPAQPKPVAFSQRSRGQEEGAVAAASKPEAAQHQGEEADTPGGTKKRQFTAVSASTAEAEGVAVEPGPSRREGPPRKQPTPTARGRSSSSSSKEGVKQGSLGKEAEEKQKSKFKGWADDELDDITL